jgi:alpha-N-arabinofuranosidase
MSSATLRLWPELAGPRISPNIYGHFAEHLGRCIYEGIWTGAKSRIPNEHGLRVDVIAALQHLRAPVLRWPGGCFADDYHWRDGIGPAKDRPTTVNLWWQQAEPNDFGTDEFMRFCQAAGTAPYLCTNIGSGTPREARNWLEYCNFSGDSTLTRLRAKHGREAPYEVKYWGIGNESWGCGGRFTAEDYATEYIRTASYMRAMDRGIHLIACGSGFGDGSIPAFVSWNQKFCEKMYHPDLIEHLSIHRYFTRGHALTFTDTEYRELFADLVMLERDIESTDAVLRYYYPDKHVGIAVDEWGCWHPEATTENGLEQPQPLRDAVHAGAVLNLFNRWAQRVDMANLAQTINVLQCLAMTKGRDMILTPTYFVFDMMSPHMGGSLVTQELETDTFCGHPMGLKRQCEIPYLSASASRSGNKLHITIANQTPDQDIELRIDLRGIAAALASGKLLHADSANAANTFETPKAVVSKRLKIEAAGTEIVQHIPRHSFTAIHVTLG